MFKNNNISTFSCFYQKIKIRFFCNQLFQRPQDQYFFYKVLTQYEVRYLTVWLCRIGMKCFLYFFLN